MHYCAFKGWQQLTPESLLVGAFDDPWLGTVDSINCFFLACFWICSNSINCSELSKSEGIMTVLQIIIPTCQFLDVSDLL